VGARALVVGLDHVAEEQRGASIRISQLERVVDPDAAFAAEEADQENGATAATTT
jgi:hypothetical protein